MKHPILFSRERLVIWWLVWLVTGASQSLFYSTYGIPIDLAAIDGMISMILFSGLTLALWYPFMSMSSGSKGVYFLLLNHLAAACVTIGLWLGLSFLINNILLSEYIDYPKFLTDTLPYRIGTGVFIYSLAVLSYYLLMSAHNLARRKSKEAHLEALVRETELKMLRAQVNPHFLFNALNSVSSLTVTDPPAAREMVIRLSDFMRYALSRKDETPVPLRKELESLRQYLEIEKVRFGNRLVIEESIEEECLEVKVPGLILQPLYENAIKHGVYESSERVTIYTTASIANESMIIEISNDYDPEYVPLRGTGTGLTNIRRRLELSYGDKASLVTAKENGLFKAKMKLPVTVNEL